MTCSLRVLALFVSIAAIGVASSRPAAAGTPFVPGTGEFLSDCSDNFEDENWSYTYNLPKSSYEQDERQRSPGARSSNGLWHEGGKRGTPDLVQRVPAPPDGIEGSTGALMFVTKLSGVPGEISNSQQQDDLLMMVNRRLGRSVPISWQPSCTVRVYLQPFEKWERRNGPSWGMRCDCQGRTPEGDTDQYWPGMFLLFHPGSERAGTVDQAQLSIRADQRGHDIRSIYIKEPGWWTFGMSFTANGQVHYFARQGVDDLTADDYLLSSLPYQYHCLTFNNFFFNVVNWENGRNWSTTWIIDDPQVYVIPPEGQNVAQLYRTRGRQQSARNQMTRSRTTGSSSASRSNSRAQR
jgi:hypothetical protein